MIKENIVVYEALKNTVLHCEDGIRNARIYMYTVYFTLLAFGFKYHWMHLVSFLVLIAFQTMINQDRIAIERISSYIRVFFEEKRNDMHWSLLNKDEVHLAIYRTQYKNLGWYINNSGASILAILSFGILIVTALKNYSVSEIPYTILVELFIACLLCILVIYVNTKMYIDNIRNQNSIQILDDSIKSFYTRCYKSDNDKVYLTKLKRRKINVRTPYATKVFGAIKIRK